MDWPSERVAQGGFLQTHKVNYSKETQDLMKVLMEESRLTMLQRKKINYHLRNGDPLPIWQQNINKKPLKQCSDPQYYNRAKSCCRRTLDSIMESDAFNVEKFIPKDAYKEPSEKAKLRLQQQMSGLKGDPELIKLKVKNKYKHNRREQDDGEFDPAEEILQEIKERIEWLDEMEKLGEAKKHRLVIQSQIQDKLAELKRLQQQQKQSRNEA